ncbi:rab GTPase-binding effector protein 2 isoform X2 [Neocloeon triangulifer]|uniref:rab GTPase-binding effector protein 2 isoform X2 n=1 Tax=Neocloeon triangulifer TaxID=2078957 RepID=UPI00286F17A0|nr:rab GTPase-binding effector protein 2 isoform X2 [Neocloeon triangulifer]
MECENGEVMAKEDDENPSTSIDELDCLREKVKKLEEEKYKIQDEFGHQRAKMKELFVQKEVQWQKVNEENSKLRGDMLKMETELGEAKSQLLAIGFQQETDLLSEQQKCQSEIASLQQLIQETVEESSSSRSKYEQKIKQLQEVNKQLDLELQNVRSGPMDMSLLGDGVSNVLNPLTAVTKSLARRVVSLAPTSTSSIIPQSSLAQEDAAMLRSLVIPLEQEIDALKGKLRHTDQDLQWFYANTKIRPPNAESSAIQESTPVVESVELMKTSTSSEHIQRELASPGGAKADVSCDMCANYETQLQMVQKQVLQLDAEKKLVQSAADRYREDLNKETEYRKEMENKWSEKKEEHKKHVERLTGQVNEAEQMLLQIRQAFDLARSMLESRFSSLAAEHEKVHASLKEIQDENEKLVGKYCKMAEEMQDECINLPDAVDELQEMLLLMREDLITSSVGKERAEEQLNDVRSELELTRNELREQLKAFSDENKKLRLIAEEYKAVKAAEQASQIIIAEFKKELEETKRGKAAAEKLEQELRNRVASLQEDLENNEATQQDFVQLSQSLQMELERLREAEKEVRWQHEDDVDECPGCKQQFSVTRRKRNCKHCGRIFCPSCLPHQVPSGPRQRLNKVCAVCHTLLVRDSAPYFSKRLPHTPD